MHALPWWQYTELPCKQLHIGYLFINKQSNWIKKKMNWYNIGTDLHMIYNIYDSNSNFVFFNPLNSQKMFCATCITWFFDTSIYYCNIVFLLLVFGHFGSDPWHDQSSMSIEVIIRNTDEDGNTTVIVLWPRTLSWMH